MIGALRESGNGDAAHDSRALYSEGKRSAVRGKFVDGESAGLERVVLHLHCEPDAVGAAMEARHNIALALHPRDFVGGGAFER